MVPLPPCTKLELTYRGDRAETEYVGVPALGETHSPGIGHRHFHMGVGRQQLYPAEQEPLAVTRSSGMHAPVPHSAAAPCPGGEASNRAEQLVTVMSCPWLTPQTHRGMGETCGHPPALQKSTSWSCPSAWPGAKIVLSAQTGTRLHDHTASQLMLGRGTNIEAQTNGEQSSPPHVSDRPQPDHHINPDSMGKRIPKPCEEAKIPVTCKRTSIHRDTASMSITTLQRVLYKVDCA